MILDAEDRECAVLHALAGLIVQVDMEEAKKKATVYIPTAAEANLWKEGMVPLWEEIAKGKPEVADALKNVRTMLKR